MLQTIAVEKLFLGGTLPALTATELIGVNRNAAVLFYDKLREVVSDALAAQTPFLAGEVEVDESYFGSHHKGKRGRGPASKASVFGVLKRGGLVRAVMITDAKSPTLMGVIRERIKPDSFLYVDIF